RVEKEIAARGQDDRTLLRIERLRRALCRFFRDVGGDARIDERLLERVAIEQRLHLAGLDVEPLPLDELALLIPARPDEAGVVEPLKAALHRAAEVGLRGRVVKRLGGELFFLGEEGEGECEEEKSALHGREGYMGAWG